MIIFNSAWLPLSVYRGDLGFHSDILEPDQVALEYLFWLLVKVLKL